MRPLILWLLLSFVTVLAAGPRPIQQITHEFHNANYYAKQTKEWKAVATNPDNCDAMAWYNYYLAAHLANFSGYQPAFDLPAIAQAAEVVLTEQDFALHYLRCRQATTGAERFAHLRAGHAAEPDRAEAYPGLAIHYLIEGDLPKYREFMRLLDTYNPFPEGVMDWSYNQLQSVGENGVLVTHGDNDTYGSLLLQAVYGVRPDVAIVNLPLMVNFPQYRKQITTALNVKNLDNKAANATEVLAALLECPRPIYLGVGAHDNIVVEQAEKLYLTGLAFRYSDTVFNNLKPLVQNYQNKWRLDGLYTPLANGPRQEVAERLYRNYLPALLELREYYLTSNEKEAQKLEQLVKEIANQNDLEQEIEDFLMPLPPSLASRNVGLKAKHIAKQFKYVPNGNYRYRADENGNFLSSYADAKGEEKSMAVAGFWLQEVEVSNADYQRFLEDLVGQRHFDVLEMAAIAKADYNSFLPKEKRDPSINSLYHERVEMLYNHPVTSVSHRAAELYAQWLSEVYNKDPKRKDGRNVRFRLPTATELAYAASGGRNWSPFPWGGPYVTNAQGCFLANFNTALVEDPKSGTNLWDIAVRKEVAASTTSEEGSCDMASDGGLVTVPVDSYFPNDFGIYNLSGNAAEMTNQDGVDVGGSWADHAREMEIGRQQLRNTPHPAVGFRLIMEYLD